MGKLLHISSSPRGDKSESLRIAQVFADTYQETHPGTTIEHWDLWDGSLPDFTVGARAKMTVIGGSEPEGAEADAWRVAKRLFDRYDEADRLLFSVPMWNGSVPYVLKQLIDVITQPGWIFGVDPHTGYIPLLADRGKKAAVIYTSHVWAPELGPAFGVDFQSTFFNDWLNWSGITDISEIRMHPGLTGDRDAARLDANEQARDIAKTF